METKELLQRSIQEIAGLRARNQQMSRELRIMEVFARLVVPQSEGGMAPDVLWDLQQALALEEKNDPAKREHDAALAARNARP